MHCLFYRLSLLLIYLATVLGTALELDNAEESSGSAGSSKGFHINPDSSILDFLDPGLLEDDILSSINSNLMSGKLVVVRDAFIPEFAEYIWKEITREEVTWTRRGYPSQHNFNPANPGHNSIKHKANAESYSKKLREVMTMFNSSSTREFMASVSGRPCSGTPELPVSEYRHGEYSSPHTDFKNMLSAGFLWNLSKDWDPTWGGAFFWGAASTLNDGFFYPTFNTLFLFLPTMTSVHFVTPVTSRAPQGSRRLTLGGNFKAGKEDLRSTTDPIEEAYGRKEDHIRLTANEAVWIAHKMDIEAITDPVRKEKLSKIKESIMDNYLYPLDRVYTVDSVDDDECNADDKEDVISRTDADVHKTNEKLDINITSQSSILDALDPSILEDDELLSDIKAKLLQGEVVIIRDAFKPEFAEYAWAELNREELKWEVNPDVRTLHSIPGHTSHKQKPIEATYSTGLLEVLELFEHENTKEFMGSLSGCSCSGPDVGLKPSWYKPNDYSSPHTDFKGERSLALIWNLSKDWEPSWGGAFYWFPSQTMEGGYQHATFNTLILFLPTPSSIHAVTPVAEWAEGKRLTIGGWYKAGQTESEFSTKNPIEDIFIKKQDHIRLTGSQSTWIVHDMNAEDVAAGDPTRKQKLLHLKETIATELVYPLDESTYIIE